MWAWTSTCYFYSRILDEATKTTNHVEGWNSYFSSILEELHAKSSIYKSIDALKKSQKHTEANEFEYRT